MLLDDDMRDEIRRVLVSKAERIESAAIFGSRATGRARANSDIDLVLYGELNDGDIGTLWTAFEDSALPVTVDVIAYRRDLYPPLRAHIDACAQPLFTRDDLRLAATEPHRS